MDISIVIPVYNEEENVRVLGQHLTQVIEKDFRDKDVEVIWVNDGSTDSTLQELKLLQEKSPYNKSISLTRNFGQSSALMAGFDCAEGAYIVTMDGDLQNFPSDIVNMIKKLEEGYDLVIGWRKNRKDHKVYRMLPSKVANWLIGLFFPTNVHDRGCGLKVFRREYIEDLELYGDLHRFIPEVIYTLGGRISEVEVNHQKRMNGKSKYGLERTFKVIFDLLTLKFMVSHNVSPMRFLGGISIIIFIIGIISLLITIYLKLHRGFDMTGNPLLLVSVFLMITSTQILSVGLVGELVIASHKMKEIKRGHYRVKKT
jgi:glycosyltransferase involved in cell wall biosynthesis